MTEPPCKEDQDKMGLGRSIGINALFVQIEGLYETPLYHIQKEREKKKKPLPIHLCKGEKATRWALRKTDVEHGSIVLLYSHLAADPMKEKKKKKEIRNDGEDGCFLWLIKYLISCRPGEAPTYLGYSSAK